MTRPDGIRERAAQLLMVRLGSNVPPPTAAEDDAKRVSNLLVDCPVGGLILFRGTWPHVRRTLDQLQAESDVPLLVGSDLERGLGQQVRGGTRFPHAMTAGHTADPEAAAAALAQVTAREARAAGIHLAFAPVADIHLHAENPIIGPRAFGDSPDMVSRCVEAYIRAARADGLLTCAKHFPGHGRTVSDSHEELPVVEASEKNLRVTDLVPFQRAIEAGVDTVMTAHVAYPSLDPSGRPATASRRILIDLLRTEMGFSGCVVSDSLLMEGIRTNASGPGEQAAELIQSGVDLLLDPQEPRAVVDGLVDAVAAGRLSRARLDEAFERVWALKQNAFARMEHSSPDQPTGTVGMRIHHAKAEQMARDGAIIRRDTGQLRRRNGGEGVVVIRFESRFSGGAEPEMKRTLADRLPAAQFRVVDPETPHDRCESVRRDAGERAVIVVAIAAEPAAWQSFGLPDDLERMAAEILDAAEERGAASMLVVLGSPRAGDRVEERSAVAGRIGRVDFFSDEDVSQKAFVDGLARRLEGTSEAVSDSDPGEAAW
ncbi:hypothetical protein CRI94_06565 [Longibacter salinarum]|uniref:beta-N-acetylhexosaminidase n=1 Tax=Longibacter salinarum TaxID=1850348 RepID=A0A2A8CYP9_9BACT|nr:glycoside hydrolase family 3 N-terminal domain-containing protein [Longibacter salinarum]PEN13733.1 hypothetical protein CRI94_06565 [Longibacter salinarum]